MNFSASISLAASGEMPVQVISSPIAFSVASDAPQAGAVVTVDLIADGVNAPTFSGFRQWDGSAGYNNTFDVRNCVTFFYRGGVCWYAIGHDASLPAEGLQPPPAPPPAPDAGILRIPNVINAVESGDSVNGWNYTSVNAGFVNGGTLDKHLQAGMDGSVQFAVNHACVTPHNSVMGFQTSPTWGYAVASIAYGIWVHQSGIMYTANSGSYISTGVGCQSGDIIRGTRGGSAIVWERLRGGTWTTICTYASAGTGLLYVWLNLSDSGSTAFNLRGTGLA